MSSNYNRGMGGGRGHTTTYQLAKPPTNHQTLQVIADEMAKPDLYSVYVAADEPITIQRYTNPDDISSGATLSPQEVLGQVDPLIEIMPYPQNPHMTYMSMQVKLQQIRMVPSALIVGNLATFSKWLGLTDDMRIHMHPLDNRTCDFVFLGLRGYVDDSLPEDRLAMLGGETANPTSASVRIGLATVMEVNDVSDVGQRTEGNSGAEEGR